MDDFEKKLDKQIELLQQVLDEGGFVEYLKDLPELPDEEKYRPFSTFTCEPTPERIFETNGQPYHYEIGQLLVDTVKNCQRVKWLSEWADRKWEYVNMVLKDSGGRFYNPDIKAVYDALKQVRENKEKEKKDGAK